MINQQNSTALEIVFFEHPELQTLFKDEATVHAWLKQYLHDRCNQQEALIGIIVNLAREKKEYFNQVIEYSTRFGDLPKKG